MNGRKGISPSVDRYFCQHGDEPIIQVIIPRNVVSSIITGPVSFTELIALVLHDLQNYR